MPASPESADTTRSSSAKLEALLAKLAVRTLELDKAAAEAGRRGSDSGSDESDCDSRAAVTQDEYTYGRSTTKPAVSGYSKGYAPTRGKTTTSAPTKRVTTSKSIYGSKQYWDNRYLDPHATIGENLTKGEINNEWYLGWSVLRPYILDYAVRSHSVVLLGCGTSTLGEDMASCGFSRITAVDYSEPSITLMRKAQQNRLASFERKKQRGEFHDSQNLPPSAPPNPTNFEVSYRVMDVTQMTFSDASFDCVLDKATLDTMCQLDEEDGEELDKEKTTEETPEETCKNENIGKQKTKKTHVARMLRESLRVLRPGGTYVCLTYGEPEDRMDFFLDLNLEWDLLTHRVVLKNKGMFAFPKPRHCLPPRSRLFTAYYIHHKCPVCGIQSANAVRITDTFLLQKKQQSTTCTRFANEAATRDGTKPHKWIQPRSWT